jgi:transcriptional regulator with GAF, ATPase, and Fis domain
MNPQSYAPVIWLHEPLQQGNSPARRQTAEAFRQARIIFSEEQLWTDEKAAVLIFDEQVSHEAITSCLREFLARSRPIIVIYTGRKALPFHLMWEWLGMGVEEIIIPDRDLPLGELIKARLERWAYIDQVIAAQRLEQQLIGSCPAWQKVLRQVVEIATFSTAPVLILGESGTGKELIARLIHQLDRRPDKEDLVLLDCSSIVPELSGSEFFGHEKGAFTNAVNTRDGAFALADRGTLFLDEIGELPLRLQAELLRVSQEGQYKRIGSNMWKKTRFRLVSATNRNLMAEVEKERFRQDLYYRICTCVVRLPALQDRRQDIPELAAHFLKMELKTDIPPLFSLEVMHYLMSRDYPGNIRELKQLMSRIAYRHCKGHPVTLGDIPEADRQSCSFKESDWQQNGFKSAIRHALADGIGLKDIKRVTANVAMEIAIEEAGGNLQQAAQRLEVSDRLVQLFLAERKI